IASFTLPGCVVTPPTAPGAPQNLTPTAGDAVVHLAWQPPSSDGNSAITEYRVYRGDSSGTETLLGPTTQTTYDDTSVTNGQTYYYTVTAVNSVGEGPASNEVSATPAASSGN